MPPRPQIQPARRTVLPVAVAGLLLTGWLLDRWLSAMRGLAPSVLAAGLVVVTAGWPALGRRRRPPVGEVVPGRGV